MNAYVMIEGTRAYPDAEPLPVNLSDEARRNAAIRGSERLRDAILTAKGHPIPEKPKKAHKQRALTPIAPRHDPVCCELCGSPLKPERRLISHIQAEVSAYYKLHPSTMTSMLRSKEISHPRQIAMFLAKELTPKSLPDIGRRFGGRDHTTVIHAIKAVTARMKADPEVAFDVEVLRLRLAEAL